MTGANGRPPGSLFHGAGRTHGLRFHTTTVSCSSRAGLSLGWADTLAGGSSGGPSRGVVVAPAAGRGMSSGASNLPTAPMSLAVSADFVAFTKTKRRGKENKRSYDSDFAFGVDKSSGGSFDFGGANTQHMPLSWTDAARSRSLAQPRLQPLQHQPQFSQQQPEQEHGMLASAVSEHHHPIPLYSQKVTRTVLETELVDDAEAYDNADEVDNAEEVENADAYDNADEVENVGAFDNVNIHQTVDAYDNADNYETGDAYDNVDTHKPVDTYQETNTYDNVDTTSMTTHQPQLEQPHDDQQMVQLHIDPELAYEAEQLDRTIVWTRDMIPKKLLKYWRQRYSLFYRFDQGIVLDYDGWFSVTPERIAQHIATRMSPSTLVIDAFCGIGGNAIQFALENKRCGASVPTHCVMAIDTDMVRLQCARQNAKVYGVDDRIVFVHGDFFHVADRLVQIRDQRLKRRRGNKRGRVDRLSMRLGGDLGIIDAMNDDAATTLTSTLDTIIASLPVPDAVFLSPPWGGPDYIRAKSYDVETMMPISGSRLLNVAMNISPNVAYFLPKNLGMDQVEKLAVIASSSSSSSMSPDSVHVINNPTQYACEVEETSLNWVRKNVTLYFGRFTGRGSNVEDC